MSGNRDLKVRCRVLRFARRLGIPLVYEKEKRDPFKDSGRPIWDGNSLLIQAGETNQNILHEISHWLVANKQARSKHEYGIGTSPDGPSVKQIYKRSRCQRDERRASLLGISFLAHYGLDIDYELGEHYWIGHKHHSVSETDRNRRNTELTVQSLKKAFPKYGKSFDLVMERINFHSAKEREVSKLNVNKGIRYG